MKLKARPCGVEYFKDIIMSASTHPMKNIRKAASIFYTQLIEGGMEFEKLESESDPYRLVDRILGYECNLTDKDMEHVYEVKNV